MSAELRAVQVTILIFTLPILLFGVSILILDFKDWIKRKRYNPHCGNCEYKLKDLNKCKFIGGYCKNWDEWSPIT